MCLKRIVVRGRDFDHSTYDSHWAGSEDLEVQTDARRHRTRSAWRFSGCWREDGLASMARCPKPTPCAEEPCACPMLRSREISRSIGGPSTQAENYTLKIMFLSIVTLSGPRKMIKFYFVGQMPILTERSCSVMVKTLFFKNIQLELLYSFRAKFLTPAKYKCP